MANKTETFESLEEKAKNAITIEELFPLWEKAHVAEKDHHETIVGNISKEAFIEDGYISQSDYLKAPIKILFILKEANVADYKLETHTSQVGFYKSFITEEYDNPPKQKEKMARMAYYLQNPKLSVSERRKPKINDLKKALEKVAFMNINKRGGGNKTSPALFRNYYDKYSTFVQREIKILNPDIIVVLGKNNTFIKSNDEKVIHLYFWHTAYGMRTKKLKAERREPSKQDYADNDANVDLYIRKFLEYCEKEKVFKKV